MDLASRRIVGWSMSDRIKADLVCQALKSAYWRRKPTAGLIMHSDRGSQYASDTHRKLIKDYGMIQSMSRRANCWVKAYVSYCTSFAGSETMLESRRLSESFVPCALRGELAPGGSNRHSFLSL